MTMTARPIAVAIVDDEASVRTALRRLCSALDLNAVTYASGRELLDALAQGAPRPDCLLLDTHMPQMTGLDLLRQLSADGLRLATVIVSADDAPDARRQYAAAGASDWLAKPIGAEELLSAVRRAVYKLAPLAEEVGQ